MSKSWHVSIVLRCGGELLRANYLVRCGACLELLCDLYGVGGRRRRINWFLVEAILYIDMGGRLVCKASIYIWVEGNADVVLIDVGGRYWKEGNKKDLWVR